MQNIKQIFADTINNTSYSLQGIDNTNKYDTIHCIKILPDYRHVVMGDSCHWYRSSNRSIISIFNVYNAKIVSGDLYLCLYMKCLADFDFNILGYIYIEQCFELSSGT